MKKTGNKTNIQIVKDYLAGERPFVQVGYSAPKVNRKVGDQWTDNNGIVWEQKNGYIARVNKQADIIRSVLNEKCSDCGQVVKWGTRRDEQAFRETGRCDECLIKFQTKLMFYGVMHLYDHWKQLAHRLSKLKELKDNIKSSVEYFKDNDGSVKMICNSEGFIETFRGFDKDLFMKEAKADLKKTLSEITKVTKAKNEAKKTFDQKYKEAEEEMKKRYPVPAATSA